MKALAIFIASVLTILWLVHPVLAADPPHVPTAPSKPIGPQTPGQAKTIDSKAPEAAKRNNKTLAAQTGTKDLPSDPSNTGTDASKPSSPQTTTNRYPEDRPWIIKRKTWKETKAVKIIPPTFSWQNQAQEKQCSTYLGQVREQFLQARYYSIQGDPCSSARHAEQFMALVDRCAQECPEDFLPKSGYTPSIVRNLRLINELGSRRCLGRLELDRGSQAVSPDAAPFKVDPTTPADPKKITSETNHGRTHQ